MIGRAGVNVAVLGDGTQQALTFVPLFTTLFIRPRPPRPPRTTSREDALAGRELHI